MRYYKDGPDNRFWCATQAWLILVGKAMHGEVMTYTELSEAMDWSDARHVNRCLGPIWGYCELNEFPPLNDLVVGMNDNRPGHKEEEPLDLIMSERKRVHGFDWYKVVPPSPETLELAEIIGDIRREENK